MLKVSSTISKKVISIYDSEVVGIIENVLFHPRLKKCIYYVIYNEKEDLDFLLKAKDVYKTSNDVLLIRNKNVLVLKNACDLAIKNLYNPINCMAFDINGKFLGKIQDLEITQPNTLSSIIVCCDECENSSIDVKDVLNFSNEVCLLQEKDSRVKLSQFKSNEKFANPQENFKVFIQADEEENSSSTPKNFKFGENVNWQLRNTANEDNLQTNENYSAEQINLVESDNALKFEIPTQANFQNNIHENTGQNTTYAKQPHAINQPKKIITDYKFLLNRTLTKNIVAPNGEIIARANSLVTTQVIKKVRAHGKLIELTQKISQ